MTSAKRIHVAPISSADAKKIVLAYHYSGKTVPNSQLHLGVFYAGKLEGVMSFGASMDKRRTVGLVAGTGFHDFLELNRLAFSDRLPRNSESRALSVAFRLIRKRYPNIEWIISFADGCQCGDGAIYRATGFVLTGIKRNTSLLRMPDGDVVAKKTLDNKPSRNGRFASSVAIENGARPLRGFQLRYIYFLNPAAKNRLTVPILPFSTIDDVGARMYKGVTIPRDGSRDNAAAVHQIAEGGEIPTPSLQTNQNS